ncbi:uncharacterized protein A4U43_C08F17280 [Asparagus officinalis]|nr:uncharacterized protein A4U43_C08F17280 [Asparagus officinalis]
MAQTAGVNGEWASRLTARRRWLTAAGFKEVRTTVRLEVGAAKGRASSVRAAKWGGDGAAEAGGLQKMYT